MLLLSARALPALAQPAPDHPPYPLTYGLGLPRLNENFGSIRALGLNGIGMALADEAYINDFNVALLPYGSEALMIDADLSYWTQARTYFDDRPAQSGRSRAAPLSKFRIPAARVAYPLLSGTLTLRAAYQPVRPYEFATRALTLLPALNGADPDTLSRLATGTARLRQYSLGAGFTMLPNITGGLQVDYLTGTFSAASLTRYGLADAAPMAPADTVATWTDGGRLRTWRLTAAVSERLRLSQTLTFRSGVSATYSLPLRTSAAAGTGNARGISDLPRPSARTPSCCAAA